MDVVPATLNYLAPRSTRNLRFVAPGAYLTTTQLAPHTVTVANGRPCRERFGLDLTGFTLLDHGSAVSDFRDDDEVGRGYVDEGRQLVAEATGADHVVSLGWVRRSAAAAPGRAEPAASEVHVDLHPDRAAARFADIHAAQGLPGRTFRRAIFSSLWRVFSPPPQDWPLALCDYRSTGDAEGLPNVMLMVDKLPRPAEVPYAIEEARARPAGTVFPFSRTHRWWYFPDMHAGEALLFKMYDSDHSVAWRTPHTAFRDPSVACAHPRESIELRTVAFFYQ
jgi:hypothetical protein